MQTLQLSQNLEYIHSFLPDSINRIKNLFSLIISKQNENSILKNKLFSHQGFFPEYFFIKLDSFSKNNITTLDLIHYLEQHQFKFNDEIVRRFVKQYDRHGNYNLIFEDFLNIIIPWDNQYNINLIENSEENRNIELYYMEELDKLFCLILINELKLIGIIGDEVLELRKSKEFDSYKIFELISNKENYLNGEMLFNFLEGKFNTMEIKRLTYFLDSNNDGLISFDDFHDLLIPIKSDYDKNENNKFIYNNNEPGQISFPIYDKNIMEDIDCYENIDFFNGDKYCNGKKTYFINYKIKTTNQINNQNKDKYDMFFDYQNNKELIMNKYMDKTEVIDEKNEIYEKVSNNNEIIGENKKPIHIRNKEIINNDNKNEDEKTLFSYKESLKEKQNSKIGDELDINENQDNQLNIIKEDDNQNLSNQINTNFNDNNHEENKEMKNQQNEIDKNLIEEINKENSVNQNTNSVKEPNINLEEDKENINNNNNIYLQKFPNTFGKNQEIDNNPKNDTKEIIDEKLINQENNNNINKGSSNSNKKKVLLKKRNQKSNKNISLSYKNPNIKKNIIPTPNNSDIQNRTLFNKSKINLELNNSASSDIVVPTTYNFPLIEDRNININIKNDKIILDDNIMEYPNLIDVMSVFFDYIRLIIYFENRFEHLKESLSFREDLSIKEIFYLFDKDKLKYITIKNFQMICKEVFKIFPTKDQIRLLFKRCKKDLNLKSKINKDFSLNKEEFMQIFIPKKNVFLPTELKNNKIDKTSNKLSTKSKNILIELIKCLLLKESNYYKMRCQFEQKTLEFIWKEIHKYSEYEDGIGINELNKFFVEHGYIFGQKQSEIIFNFFDKDKKGLITDIDFFEEMYCQ